MVYLDFRSLCLIIAMRRSGRGSGRRLVPYSLRFALTEPHRRHTARGLGLGWPALDPVLRFVLTMPHNCHAAIWPGLGPAYGPVQP
jgi:hypothetical protein